MSAADVQTVAITLLSPSGRIIINEVSSTNSTKTRELVIVEDLPDYLSRIERYITEVDQPPLQVLIETHILQVTLKNNTVYGVEFSRLGELANIPVSTSTPNFNGTITDLSAYTNPSYSVTLLESGQSSALIDVLKEQPMPKHSPHPKSWP